VYLSPKLSSHAVPMASHREGLSLQDALEGKDYSFPNEVCAPTIALDPLAHRLSLRRCNGALNERALVGSQEEKIYQLWKDLDAFKKQLEMTEGMPEYAPRRRVVSRLTAQHTARRVAHCTTIAYVDVPLRIGGRGALVHAVSMLRLSTDGDPQRRPNGPVSDAARHPQVLILRRPALRHRPAALRPHPRGDHQGVRRDPSLTPCTIPCSLHATSSTTQWVWRVSHLPVVRHSSAL
jgi:hypothetical protein